MDYLEDLEKIEPRLVVVKLIVINHRSNLPSFIRRSRLHSAIKT